MARKLEVQIVGDASSLKRALGDADSSTSKFGSALGGIAKAGVLAAGAAGIGGLFVTLRAGIDDFKESARVSAQTEAVIKSTGGTARVTAGEVGKLAQTISNYSGVDDEAVQAGENMLLTFTNIRNEAGKGNDVFSQATRTLTDMSVALGTDSSKSAIQLGKALNDPVKGITALTKVGVTFTDSQRASIKAMVDAGDTAGAQKVILAELNKEFGGSAKAAGDTLPGQLDKLKNAFGNMSGALVGAAVPALTSFVGLVADKGLPAIGKLFDAISSAAGPVLAALGDAFRSAGPGIMNVLSSIGNVIRDDLVPIWQKLAEIGGTAITKIGDVLRDNGPQIHKIFENIGGVIRDVASVAMPLIKFAFDTVLPIALRIAIPILEATTTAIRAIFDAVKWVADNVGAPITTIKNTFTAVRDWVSTKVGEIVGFWRDLPGNVRDAFVGAWDSIKGRITGAFDGIVTFVSGLPGRIGREFAGIPGAIAAELKGKAGDLWDAVKGIFDKLPGFVKKALGISSPSRIFQGIGTSIMEGAIKGIRDKAGDLMDAAWDAFSSIASTVGGAVGGVVGGGPRSGSPTSRIVELGRLLQAQGFQVGENPAFGGVSPVHTAGSYHYQGRAIDVNWPGGGPVELAHLRAGQAFASKFGPIEDMIEDAGGRNQHLHVALAKGGVFTEPWSGHVSLAEKGPEGFVPLDRYGGFGSTVVNVTVQGSVTSEDELVDTIHRKLREVQGRNETLGLR